MWSMEIDPSLRTLPPRGLPLAIIVISYIFLALSIVTVALRTYIRLRKGTFGLDDGMMAAGTVVYMVVVGLAVYGCYVGLGRLESELNAFLWAESLKFYITWILTYVGALALVKTSVCVTILRIASSKRELRIAVYVLLFITWASFLVTFIGTLLYCQPVKSLWTPALLLSGKGKCAPVFTLIALGHVATSSAILTDIALVIVPGVILWNTQMKRQPKIQAFGLLSFASVASIITMVRIPYVNKFKSQTDLQFVVAHIMLCSNIETGIGCVASSIPSLRHLIRGVTNADSSDGPSARRTGGNRSGGGAGGFFGGSKVNNGQDHGVSGGAGGSRFQNPTDTGFSLSTITHHAKRGDDSWERLRDGDSDKGILTSSSDEAETRGGNSGLKAFDGMEHGRHGSNGAKGTIRADYTFTVDIERSDDIRR